MVEKEVFIENCKDGKVFIYDKLEDAKEDARTDSKSSGLCKIYKAKAEMVMEFIGNE